jgi:hypothetical protein
LDELPELVIMPRLVQQVFQLIGCSGNFTWIGVAEECCHGATIELIVTFDGSRKDLPRFHRIFDSILVKVAPEELLEVGKLHLIVSATIEAGHDS